MSYTKVSDETLPLLLQPEPLLLEGKDVFKTRIQLFIFDKESNMRSYIIKSWQIVE